MIKISAPRNNLARMDAQRRGARAAVPSRLPPSPKAGQAQTKLIKGR